MATIESYQDANGAKRYMVRYRTPQQTQTKKRGFNTKRDAEDFAATVEVEKLKAITWRRSSGRSPWANWPQRGCPARNPTWHRRTTGCWNRRGVSMSNRSGGRVGLSDVDLAGGRDMDCRPCAEGRVPLP